MAIPSGQMRRHRKHWKELDNQRQWRQNRFKLFTIIFIFKKTWII